MDRILQILAELRPDVDFTLAQNLIDDGVLDSFDVVSLVSELCDAFEVSISVDDLTPENFNTPEAMLALVERLQNE
ncbi:MAG TPA: acyl carrier protein [Candidatus Limiplasma pullistercoris]|nr:acyl carrier protein [Candidatus Limiplasma pullistercoris]